MAAWHPLLWNLQEFSGLNAKSLRKAADDAEACVECAFLELAEIAATYIRLVSQLVLRDALCIAQSSQIGGEHLPQIHAGSQANCSIYSTSIYLTKYRTEALARPEFEGTCVADETHQFNVEGGGLWMRWTFATACFVMISSAGVISLHRSFDDMQSCRLNSD